jgi:hypothetical protein
LSIGGSEPIKVLTTVAVQPLRSTAILSCLPFQGSLTFNFLTKILHAFLNSPTGLTRPAHLNLLQRDSDLDGRSIVPSVKLFYKNSSCTAWAWRLSHYDPSKRWEPFTQRQCHIPKRLASSATPLWEPKILQWRLVVCVCVCVRARARVRTRRWCQHWIHPHRVRSYMVYFVVGQRDLLSILPLEEHRTFHEGILAPTEV